MSTEARANNMGLSNLSRQLVRLVAVLFMVLGIVLFFVPDWASSNFAWKVSPFVAMTMGAWYIGNGFMAWEAARVWKLSSVYPCLVTLGLFSLLELGVLGVHSDLLRLGSWLGMAYLLILVVAAVVTLVCIADWARLRPAMSSPSSAEAMSSVHRAEIIAFTIAVLIIAVFPILGYGRGGTIFPEKLSLFTLHAFGVFYLSLALGAATLIREKSLAPLLVFARTGLALVYPITLAALLNLDKFDFVARPGGLIYLGVYVIVGIVTTILVVRHWSGVRDPDVAPTMQTSQ